MREESVTPEMTALIDQVEAAALPDHIKQTIINLIRQHGGDHE